MNLGSHLVSHWEMFKHLVEGDDESAVATQKFYDEYRSVARHDRGILPADRRRRVPAPLLPKGELMHRGHKVDPKAIKDTALLAIEGERDDISGIGQTRAALDISSGLTGVEEAIFPRQGCRSLRHLQRPQVAREDRAGRRGLDRQERLTSGFAHPDLAEQGHRGHGGGGAHDGRCNQRRMESADQLIAFPR